MLKEVLGTLACCAIFLVPTWMICPDIALWMLPPLITMVFIYFGVFNSPTNKTVPNPGHKN